MAKYTESLFEYLQDGNELPSLFSLIDGFEELFKARYMLSEIGFETEDLFKIKLNYYAKIYIPRYKILIEKYDLLIENLTNPSKVSIELNNSQAVGGEQNSSTTELPIDSLNATPSIKNHSDSFTNTSNSQIQRSETGLSNQETIQTLQFVQNARNTLIGQLLEEFKNCFMVVY